MPKKTPETDLPWPPPEHRPSRAELAAPATQIVRDREDYLGQGVRDIGRRIADDQVELFVSGDLIAALQQQFDRLAPEMIALHDVGTSASLRLLGALAGAAGARVQRLTLRRQGHGVALATVQFVEVPLAQAAPVRIYSTDVNADTQMRQALAGLLLGRSKLAVLMLGELPPHALPGAMAPLREAMARPTWTNSEMLLLPLGSASALAAQAAQLVAASGVSVRVTPQAARPNDAWAFVSGAWNRMHGNAAVVSTELSRAVPKPAMPMSEAPTEVMPLSQPAIAGVPPAPAIAPSPRWTDYVQRCAAIKGVVSACVFDLRNQHALAFAGAAPPPDRLAIQGGLLIDGMSDAARQLGLPATAPEAAISYGEQHLLLRPVPGHAGIVIHLVLQASANNLTLARMQLERVTAPSAG